MRTVQLSSVADFYTGNSLPVGTAFNAQTDGYLLTRVSDMNLPGNERVISRAQQWNSSPGARSATCPPNSLIIPKRGGAIGTNKKRLAGRPCVLDPNLMAISPHAAQLDSNYLYQWFQAFDLSSIANGSSVPQLNKKDLAPLEIPLPPIATQRRIARMLDHVDELRAMRRQAAVQLDDLAQSIFIEMFGEPMKNERGWKTVSVADAGVVQLGRQRAPKYQTGKHTRPYIRVANVFEDRIDLSDVLSMDFDGTDYPKYRLKIGDILLNEGQSTELVGRPAMWRNELEGSCFQNTLLRFQANSTQTHPTFALGVFLRYFRTGEFAKISSKTSSVAHLGAARFAGMPFPLPPLELQESFSRRIESVRELRQANRSHGAGLDDLFASLQSRAFRGELWPEETNPIA
ncbi:type I restriction enzyme S subunit [Streptacidiphilus sp. BW17]|uniref:restriction endonuclease subunit S n=1 Tax=Streptacidiphilus sp. BW17 TaxID=3156274 RepID=UPI003512EC5C